MEQYDSWAAETEVSMPGGYLVEDSPNDDENGTLCCPHDRCDGMTFDSPDQCRRHDLEWHRDTYKCTYCGAQFTCQSVLVRHARAELHHQDHVCRRAGCPFEGVHFGDAESLEQHEAQQHPAGLKREGSSLSTPPGRFFVSPCDDWDAFTEGVCREPCCQKFDQCFPSESVYAIHEKSAGHRLAGEMDEGFRKAGLTGAELEENRKAARDCKCCSKSWPQYGYTYTSGSYVSHLKSLVHTGRTPLPSAKSSSIGRGVFVCELRECPRYQHVFKTANQYNGHLILPAHRQASSGRSNGSGSIEASPGGSQSDKPSPPTMLWLSKSPKTPNSSSSLSAEFGTPSPSPLLTPTSSQVSGRKRRRTTLAQEQYNEELATKNAELEVRIRELEQALEEARITSQKNEERLDRVLALWTPEGQ